MADFFIFEAEAAQEIIDASAARLAEEKQKPQPFQSIVVPQMIEGGKYRGRLGVDAACKAEPSLQYLLDAFGKYKIVDMDTNLAWPGEALADGKITKKQADDAKVAQLEPTPVVKADVIDVEIDQK